MGARFLPAESHFFAGKGSGAIIRNMISGPEAGRLGWEKKWRGKLGVKGPRDRKNATAPRQ